MDKVTNLKYKVKKVINKSKFQDEIDELRFELASTQDDVRRAELREAIEDLEEE